MKYLLIFIIGVLVSLALVHTVSLTYFFDGSIISFNTWYPRFYILAFIIAKFSLPFISGLISFLFMKKKDKINSCLYLLPYVLFFTLINLFYGLENATIALIISSALIQLYLRRNVLKEIWLSIYSYRNENVFIGFLVGAVLIGVVGRIVFGFWAENAVYGDAHCRHYIAHIWSRYYLGYAPLDKVLNPSIDWLPLHFYILGTIWKFSNSVKLLVLIHVMVGIASAYFVYKIARMYTSLENSLVATFCYLIYPSAIGFSTALMSEPWFVFASFAALYYFIKLLKTNKSKYSFIYLISITGACLLRYEAWPMLIAIPILHYAWSRGIVCKGLLVHLAAFTGPVFIMLILIYQGHHPLRGIIYSDVQVAYCFDITGRTLSVLFEGYRAAIVPGFFLFFFIGAYFYRYKSDYLLYVLFAVCFILPFAYKLITFSIVPHDRYLAKYVVVFIPGFVIGLSLLYNKILPFHFFGKKLLFLFVATSLTCFGYQYTNYMGFKFKDEFKNCVQYVNTLSKANIILDHHRALKGYSFMAMTDLPFLPEYQDDYLSQFIDFRAVKKALNATHKASRIIKYTVNDYDHEFKTTDFDLVKKTLIQNEDVYLILFPEGDLNSHFQFTKEIEIYKGISFIRVFSDHGYLVYRKQ